MNNAARDISLDNRFQLLSGSQLRQKITLEASEETGESTYTASRITPFNSAFATTRETPPVDLIVAYSHARQMKWQRRLTLILLLSGVVGLALVYLISYIISRRITRPLATLRQGLAISLLVILIIALSSNHTMRSGSLPTGSTGWRET